MRAPTVNRNDDSKDNFYEELEQVFDHFPTYNMQILLGCCKAKFGQKIDSSPQLGKTIESEFIKHLRKCENTK